MNSLRRWLTVCAAAVLMSIGPGAGVAQAHPTLLFTEPGAEIAVAVSPPAITLLFNEAVTIDAHAITVLDSTGRDVPMVPPTLAREGRFVSAQPARTLQPGTYTVRWRVTGSDGDEVEQEFRFAVGVAISAGATAGAPSGPSWGQTGWRWLLFAGLTLAVGGLIAQRFTATARADRPALPRVRSWVAGGLVLALAGVAGLIAHAILTAGAITAAWNGRAAAVLLAEAAGLLAALAILKLRLWALVPLAVVIVAEGIRSHAGISDGVWGAMLTAVHLAAVTIWSGALIHTVRAAVSWRRVPEAARGMLGSYVRLAFWVYLVVISTGVITMLVLVPLSQLFSTNYGRVLLIKVGIIAVASLAALAARMILHNPARWVRLRAIMASEASLLIIVLIASAVLVSTPTPSGSAAAAPPPQPSGPVLALGTLVGQIGLSATASDGLLVLRLSTPQVGDYYADQPQQTYGVTLSVGDRVLQASTCGSSCYYAHPDWRTGDNVLTVRAEAAGWAGGTTGLIVSWPPRPGAAELTAAGRGNPRRHNADRLRDSDQ